MKTSLTLTSAIIALGLSSSAFANTYTWNLAGSTSHSVGDTETLLSNTGNISMSFAGFLESNNTLTPTALYSKNEGGDEIGLGIAADPSGDHEIFPNSFVQINLTDLLAQKQISSVELTIGSVQCREGFSVWGSNDAIQPGTLLYTGNSTMDDVAFAVPNFGSYKYISVSATTGNVLLDTVTAASACMTTTPEPGTLALGLVAGLGLLARKLAIRSVKVKA